MFVDRIWNPLRNACFDRNRVIATLPVVQSTPASPLSNSPSSSSGTMDKPLGPRTPDKRHAAYEDIFGRPSTSHHQQFYHTERRTSTSSYNPNLPQYTYYQHQQPAPGPPYARQSTPSYYPQQPQYPQQYSPQQAPSYPQSLAPPSHVSRARSIQSNPYITGVIVPQPEEPPDPALAHPGLTPAQAYQAQVYLKTPAGSQANWDRLQSSPLPPDKIPYPQQAQNGGPSIARPPDNPKLGVSLEYDDGRLGIDFGAGGNSSDDSSSELPWAQTREIFFSFKSISTFDESHLPSAEAYSTGHYPDQQQQTFAPSPAGPMPSTHRLSTASDQQTDASSTLAHSIRSSFTSSSPTSTEHSVTMVDHHLPSGRRSSESTRTVPRIGGPRRERTAQDRAMSMSAAPSSMRSMVDQSRGPSTRPPVPSLHDGVGGRHSPVSMRHPPRKTPIVYPALLSRVAEAFRDRIPLTDHFKDGLTYKDAFDGREAVDKIAYIIKTTDRNLALLLGRALDAQKFFHDVTYDHRLRDSAAELYQFRTKLPSPFVSGELVDENNLISGDDGGHDKDTPPLQENNSSGDLPNVLSPDSFDSSALASKLSSSSPATRTRPRAGSISSDEAPLPSGVFTLLTDCYSPTCSRDQLCYSIACPRRLEQQARLNMKPQPGLSKQISKESLGDDGGEEGMLWIHSVPAEIVGSVSEKEKRRQEAINEVIYTERDFVRDMEYLRDVRAFSYFVSFIRGFWLILFDRLG